MDGDGLHLFQKLTVFTGRGRPSPWPADPPGAVQQLREAGTPAARRCSGIWATRGRGDPHGDRMFALGRRVPGDHGDRHSGSDRTQLSIVDELTAEQGLVTCETVPAMVALDGDERYGGISRAGPSRRGNFQPRLTTRCTVPAMETTSSVPASTVSAALEEILRDDLNVDGSRVTRDSHPDRRGGPGLVAFAVGMVAIADKLGVALSEEDLLSCNTVGDLENAILAKVPDTA